MGGWCRVSQCARRRDASSSAGSPPARSARRSDPGRPPEASALRSRRRPRRGVDRLAGLRIEEVEPGGVDRQPDRVAGPAVSCGRRPGHRTGHCSWVSAISGIGVAVALVARRRDRVLGEHGRRVDREDHVDLRAELLGDLGRRPRSSGRSSVCHTSQSSRSDGRIPRIDGRALDRPSRPASGAERES